MVDPQVDGEVEPALGQGSDVWLGIVSHWLQAVYDHDDLEFADGVLADPTPGDPLCPAGTGFNQIPTFSEVSWTAGVPGSGVRSADVTITTGPSYAAETVNAEVDLDYHVDSTGRPHVLTYFRGYIEAD
ncbi:MAG TPA: hypothetical protein VGJ28_05400 [Micromonosporaceae bacterium]|jgi:hypothetical protein